jgi:hypothetical protein
MTEDVSARVRRFRAELVRDRDRFLLLGRWNYRAAYILVIVTVVSSAAAGILGLGFTDDTKLIALLAFIPGIAVIVSNQFKWQDKANWHYRKHDAAKAMLRRLDYELPSNPTEAQLAQLATGYSVIEAEMTKTFEELRFEVAAAEAAEEAAEEDLADDEAEDGEAAAPEGEPDRQG